MKAITFRELVPKLQVSKNAPKPTPLVVKNTIANHGVDTREAFNASVTHERIPRANCMRSVPLPNEAASSIGQLNRLLLLGPRSPARSPRMAHHRLAKSLFSLPYFVLRIQLDLIFSRALFPPIDGPELKCVKFGFSSIPAILAQTI